MTTDNNKIYVEDLLNLELKWILFNNYVLNTRENDNGKDLILKIILQERMTKSITVYKSSVIA